MAAFAALTRRLILAAGLIGLAVILRQSRLGIECIDLRGAAGHEEKDDSFGRGGEVGTFGRQRVGRIAGIFFDR